MLEANHCPEISQTSKLEVILPEHWHAFFNETGYAPSTPSEERSNARLRVRSAGELTFFNTPAALQASVQDEMLEKSAGQVLIKDLSRGGIGILYHRQIFPEQQFRIHFQGRRIEAVAVRCRRLGDRCFETGGRILSLETLDD